MLECQSSGGRGCPAHEQGQCQCCMVSPSPQDGGQQPLIPPSSAFALVAVRSITSGLLAPYLPPTASPIRNLLGTAPERTMGNLTQRLTANSRRTGQGVAGREAEPTGCLSPARELGVLCLLPGQQQLQVCWGRCLHIPPESQAVMREVLLQMGRILGWGCAFPAPSQGELQRIQWQLPRGAS